MANERGVNHIFLCISLEPVSLVDLYLATKISAISNLKSTCGRQQSYRRVTPRCADRSASRKHSLTVHERVYAGYKAQSISNYGVAVPAACFANSLPCFSDPDTIPARPHTSKATAMARYPCCISIGTMSMLSAALLRVSTGLSEAPLQGPTYPNNGIPFL